MRCDESDDDDVGADQAVPQEGDRKMLQYTIARLYGPGPRLVKRAERADVMGCGDK